MSLINLLQIGLTDDAVSRNLGFTPAGQYDVGVTSLDTYGSGSALVAAPRNFACEGWIAYGITVSSDVGASTPKQWPPNISTMILAPGSDTGSGNVVMPAAVVPGMRVTLGCFNHSVTTLVMTTGGSNQSLQGALTSISPNQFASWQALLFGGTYYWMRVG